ncbi:hypothetical protein ACFXJ8_33215 [Nonomuraea sp. NPDC059194]|uniref:hypothetical protein n=1 Tax=Nonomuraea sp. NPDC059194 TaxID=3346764 RepID=UPI0036C73943
MRELTDYAAAIAPLIDAVHIDVHAADRRAGVEYVRRSGLRAGFLIDQRYVLPLRPLTRAALATVYRYGTAEEQAAEVAVQLLQGTLREDEHGGLHATPATLAFVDGLYELHERATARIWAGREELVSELAALLGRLLDGAERMPGGALEVMAPPYEPEGVSPGVALFNRIAAFRYHRADAHAAAWQVAGLTAQEITALREGPLWEAVERDTNLRAAVPYRMLEEAQRTRLFQGLRELSGV